MILAEFKSQYSNQQGLIHFNNAGIAPWPKRTLEAVQRWSERLAVGGTHTVGQAFDESELSRAKLARLMGASADEIAFFTTCATAISQVAFGFPLKAGDEILVWDQEYPSNFHPWRVAAERAGAKLVIASSDENLGTPVSNLEKCVTSKTRVIAVSWVQYRSGAVTDLLELSKIAAARGIFTCVDIIQGLGALPFDFADSGLDAVCGGAHKWLTSPLSLGFLALKAKHRELLSPIMVGAMSYGGPDVPSSTTVPMVKGMQKFEPGGRQLLEMIGLGHTLDLFHEVGALNVSQEVVRLARELANGLNERGYKINQPNGEHQTSGIVNFSPTSKSSLKTEAEIASRLTDMKVSFSKRAPGVRLSPHGFNTDDEIQKLLRAMGPS